MLSPYKVNSVMQSWEKNISIISFFAKFQKQQIPDEIVLIPTLRLRTKREQRQ